MGRFVGSLPVRPNSPHSGPRKASSTKKFRNSWQKHRRDSYVEYATVALWVPGTCSLRGASEPGSFQSTAHMEQIFIQLGQIIVRALPTFFVIIVLHWYLKKVLFQPMERALEERRQKTEGVIEASEATTERMREKLARYEESLREARAQIYQAQAEERKVLLAKQAEALDAAKSRQSERVAAARAGISGEAEAARRDLAGQVERLAEHITSAVLTGRAQ